MIKANFFRHALLAAALASGFAAPAQTVWTNTAGGSWNTAANWNPNLVPVETINVTVTNFTTAAFSLTYSAPMAATSIGSLTLNDTAVGQTLAISAAGFNVSGTTTLRSNALLRVNGGGVMTNGIFNIAYGRSTATALAVINGGSITNGATQVSNDVNNDGGPMFITNGATADLGTVTVGRSGQTAFSSGLTILNSTVAAGNVTVGALNSYCTMSVGGLAGLPATTVNISGNLTVANGNAAARPCLFTQTNGTVNVAGAINLASAANQTATFTIGGSGILNANGGIVIFPNAITGATNNFTDAGTIYLGSSGLSLANPSGNIYNVSLNDLGLLGAAADWSANADVVLKSGAFTFKAADSGGTAHNITLNGTVRGGTGSLNKTGGGVLLLNTNNTYTGATIVGSGSLALGAVASISNSTPIIVGSSATLDVSQVTGGFVLNAGQTLTGFGTVTGAVTAVSGSTIDAGTNNGIALNSTLLLTNGLAETGGVLNKFHLSSNPLGASNDLVVIGGDLNVSGSNTVQVVGTLPNGVNYALFKYSGNFIGNVTNFGLLGAVGVLSNSVAGKAIYLTTLATTRGPSSTVWIGNPVNTNWDVSTSTNWLNGAALDYFIPNDTVRFTSVGAANSPVNLVGSLTPTLTTVDTVSNYIFIGTGSIDGGDLLKTNSGTLTILTTNNYSGITTINGGVLEVQQLASSPLPSAIGAATIDPAKLVINNGTFRYNGPSVTTDRGATLNDAAATMDVPANSLTVGGGLVGTGGLTKIGAGTLILNNASSYAGATTVSNGNLQINTVAGALAAGAVNFNGGTLTLSVSSQQTYSSALNVLSTGTLVSAGGNNNIVQAPWSGTGTLNLSIASGTFTINANMTPSFTGAIRVSDASAGTLRFNGGGNGSGAQQSTGSATATFDLGNSTATLLNRNGGAAAFGIYSLGALAGGSGTFLKGAANGGGAVNASFYSIGAKNLNTTFAGTIANGTGGSGATTSIIKVGAGIFTLTGNNSYTGSTTVSNGVLALGDGVTDGAIGSSAAISVSAGAVLDVSGRADKKLSLNSGQILGGNGSVFGDLDTAAGSTVSPGAAIGTLTVTNLVTLGGDVYVELNRTNGAQTNDILKAASLVLGGSLTVTNLGPNLVAGDRFVLFKGAVSGAFATVNLPENLGSVTYAWTNKTAIDGSIQVLTAVSVNTNPTNITASVSGSTLTLSWPADRTGWRLQSQTNSLGSGLGSVWTDIPGTGASNTYNATIDPANGTVFYRMVYP
jgi:autotransporter-associated beta strand protein